MRHVSLVIAASALATASPAPAGLVTPEMIRSEGPAALERLLAEYDQAKPGPDRDALASVIDQVAAQRYATTSRLYWYTDLGLAKAAAEQQHKPILALRMLGDLREDLSCANSRLFRTTLYANAEVSKFLRDSFILYWSSERDVPKVTIDLGKGRKIETTITGNSAHYVLDEHGNVIDVLPGLYAPATFKAELTVARLVALQAAKLGDAERGKLVVKHHQRLLAQSAETFGLSQVTVNGIPSELYRAQRVTVGKGRVELPIAKLARVAQPAEITDPQQWIEIGSRFYKGQHLDERATALVASLYDQMPATPQQRAAMFAALEASIGGDTAVNQLKLRPQISALIVEAGGKIPFTDLNNWIYSNVFATPASDAWLGLLPRTDFTGLPGDGAHVTSVGAISSLVPAN